MNRELRQALKASAEGRAYLARQEGAKRARARRVGAKPAVKDRKAAASARRDERLRRLARIRSDLFMEMGGTCVVCLGSVTLATMEAHHLVSGPSRRLEESQETMAPTCGRCHRAAHAGDLSVLEALRTWCLRSGRVHAAGALAKRIDKVTEARGASRALEGR